MPEMHEADVVECRCRLKARDVPAELRGMLVRPQHDRQRVPADEGTDPVLDRAVARMAFLSFRRDRIEVRRICRVRNGCAPAPCSLDYSLEQVMRPIGPFDLDHAFEGIEPFLSFG